MQGMDPWQCMAPTLRDRISVDLRGSRGALVAQARARGVAPPDLVRGVSAEAFGAVDSSQRALASAPPRSASNGRLLAETPADLAAASGCISRVPGVPARARHAGRRPARPSGVGCWRSGRIATAQSQSRCAAPRLLVTDWRSHVSSPEHRRRPDPMGRPTLLSRQPRRQSETAAEAGWRCGPAAGAA